jgi:hypothetical protein
MGALDEVRVEMNETQALTAARESLGEREVTVKLDDGHSGIGWYAWVTAYPEEGSIFLSSRSFG